MNKLDKKCTGHIYNFGIRNYISVCLFLVIYFVWVFAIHISRGQYFTQFNIDYILRNFNLVIICLLMCYFLLAYKINKVTILDVFFSIIFFISFLFSKSGILFFLFILASRNIPFRLVLKAFFVATITGMLFIYFTYLFDLYSDSYLDLFRTDGTYRYLLGYRFPTFMPNYFFHLVLCWVVIRKSRIAFVELGLIVLINFILYKYTDTRAVYYLINLVCLGTVLLKCFKVGYSTLILGKIFAFLTRYSFILFASLAIYLHYTYDPNLDWMVNLNTILSGRLELGKRGFDLYGMQFFGSKVEFITMLHAENAADFFYIDSAYVQLLLVFGIFIFSLIAIGYISIGKKIVARNDKYFALALIFLFLHSVTDPQLISPEFNPFLLCLGYYGLDKYRENLFK
ncbi:hypothetical protein P7L91_09040 [Bisgaard Taxon 10/6]|uniref:hypothetical protein n=1 Tax=Exercitatus varius TaxID=67857 RepID=UPI00294B4EF7|nr:hypothetical protein [Exercitatus varius]MDG2960979.1 hypothetical protein [Exercitatus varius]